MYLNRADVRSIAGFRAEHERQFQQGRQCDPGRASRAAHARGPASALSLPLGKLGEPPVHHSVRTEFIFATSA
jgi:hypothetical protein